MRLLWQTVAENNWSLFTRKKTRGKLAMKDGGFFAVVGGRHPKALPHVICAAFEKARCAAKEELGETNRSA